TTSSGGRSRGLPFKLIQAGANSLPILISTDFARYGSIWTTKNLIGKLDSNDLETFSFGTHRQDQGRDIFIKNSFIRVTDIIDSTDKRYDKLADISTLPVTEVISRK
ncbi:MAG: hypothetical protein SV487_10290, partial [Thermodesulfobacteriota bacterium]|nr:hypothetical protein [Thermodesulfobacteriota bacterium]